ncbi:MAG TPA: hypothetical protein VFW63_12705, partial [Acidimicrobiales bacterium]|nr:hypothetical protein [Acidimicrobiales bacterium]
PRPARLTRRQVLTMAAAGGLVGAGLVTNRWVADGPGPGTGRRRGPGTAGRSAGGPSGLARWSDPATWGGRVPGPDDVVGLSRPVLLDVDAAVAGVDVRSEGELVFDPEASRTLTSRGNVVVAGKLRARPRDASVQHVLRFPGVDERDFAGGPTATPVASDVGLWVIEAGVLDAAGTPKTSWTTLAAAGAAGDATIVVADAAGWRPGDEVVVTATRATDAEGFAEAHDRRTVTAVEGSTLTLDEPLDHDHPAVTVRPGTTYRAEVLNLTRNVRIEGTRHGRAHVMLLGTRRPQAISHVALRHLGPQEERAGGRGRRGIGGRYSLHFHMAGDGSRGSLVEGVVACDGGNHSFVPHLSNGVTFRDCIAHDQAETAYWWDPATERQHGDEVPTHDLLYERCVASHIRPTDASEYDTAGFVLGTGRGNVARGCVATGILGRDESTPGYIWNPDSRDDAHAWTFEDNLSHNNDGASLYFWINNTPPTVIDRFTAYHDRLGIRAGSYANLVSYRDVTVYACREVGILVVAVPGTPEERPDLALAYEGVYVDQAGRSDFAVEIGPHVVDADQVTHVRGCTFRGGRRAQVGFAEAGEHPQLYDFTDCTYDGNAFWLADDLADVVRIRVRDPVNGALALHPAGRPGRARPEWNARVTPLAGPPARPGAEPGRPW